LSIKRQSLWSLLPLMATTAVGFVSVPVYLHCLSAEMYALWICVGIFSSLFSFADLGLGQSMGRYIGVALGKEDTTAVRGYWGTGNLIVVPFLLLVALSLMGLGAWLGPKWYNLLPAHVRLFRACVSVAGMDLFFSYYSQCWNVLAQAHLDFKFIGILRTITSLLKSLPMIVLAYLTGNPLALFSWGAMISLLELCIFMVHARRHYGLGFHFRAASLERLREMRVYIGKNFSALIVGSLFAQIDRQVVARLAPARDIRNYGAVGNQIAARLQGLSSSVMGPVFYNTTRRAAGAPNASAAAIYNETFAFVFDWYLLAALWLGLWHPVFLRLWLGPHHAAEFDPLIIPLVAAACINAIANISVAQLASLNRLGAIIGFSITGGVLAAAGAWLGWHLGGVAGAAYGFLCSRIAFLAQDLFAIRLLKAGGWLSGRTWRHAGLQCAVAAVFATGYFVFAKDSFWLLIPAVLHGGLVAAFVLRQPLGKMLAGVGDWQKSLSSAARE
jgi:O-antigen/teichoic acid export membrane protein